MPTLLLVRHGETDWNRTGQIMGERPIPLNQYGESQAQRLAELLRTRSIRAMYSSPVARARQTAHILAGATRAAVSIDQGLTEINLGDWVGRNWKDLADDLIKKEFYANPRSARPPGGETLDEVQLRAVSCVERTMTDLTHLGHEEPLLLFVSHADVLRTIIAHYLRLPIQTIRQIRIDHASLTALKINGATTDLLFLNFTPDAASLK